MVQAALHVPKLRRLGTHGLGERVLRSEDVFVGGWVGGGGWGWVQNGSGFQEAKSSRLIEAKGHFQV